MFVVETTRTSHVENWEDDEKNNREHGKSSENPISEAHQF
jgi:hypothetical protein